MKLFEELFLLFSCTYICQNHAEIQSFTAHCRKITEKWYENSENEKQNFNLRHCYCTKFSMHN